MRWITKTVAVAVAAMLPIAASALPILKPATPDGSKQVEAFNGNSVVLLGISGGAEVDTPYTVTDFLASILESDRSRMLAGYYAKPQGSGEWHNGTPGTQMMFGTTDPSIKTLSSPGKLFDSIWAEFRGTSDLNFIRPDGGTDVVTQSEILGLVGDVRFPDPTAVPEPGTLALLGAGLLGLGAMRRRRHAA